MIEVKMVPPLEQLLWAEPVSVRSFRAARHVCSHQRRLYGGYLAAQAIVAAGRTVDPDLALHSFHTYFLESGTADLDLELDVDLLRDGRTYSHRMVRAGQEGKEVLRLTASYKRREAGAEDRVVPMPDVAPPDSLDAAAWDGTTSSPDDPSVLQDHLEVRFVSTHDGGRPHRAAFWIKTSDTVSDEPRRHEAALTFLSDFGLASTASLTWEPMPLRRVGGSRLVKASLDHAMWIHNGDFRADQWLLVDQESSFAGDGRGHSSARVFTADGRLVASIAQETVQRLLNDRTTKKEL